MIGSKKITIKLTVRAAHVPHGCDVSILMLCRKFELILIKNDFLKDFKVTSKNCHRFRDNGTKNYMN